VLISARSNFPIIGTQLARPEGLQWSTGAVVVGSLAAFYGCIGLGVAIQNVINTAWAVPRNSRPNPLLIRLNSLGLLFTAGVAVLLVTVFSAVVGNTEVFGNGVNTTIRWLIRIANVLIVGMVLTALLRMAAASRHISAQSRSVLMHWANCFTPSSNRQDLAQCSQAWAQSLHALIHR
jgi:uncharacterized BrkB/YihY/UPF0761 family membrane protein